MKVQFDWVSRWLSGSVAAFTTAIISCLVAGLLTVVVALGYIWLPSATAKPSERKFSQSNLQNLPDNPSQMVVRALATPTADPDELAYYDPDDDPYRERETTTEAPLPPDLGRLNPGPGVTYYRTKRPIAGGEAVFNVLEIADITDPRIGLKVSLPKGQVQGYERVTDQMQRNGPKVVAAINGDFFDIGKPYGGVTINMQLQNGELVRTNEGQRPAFGIGKDGLPLIGVPRTSGKVTIGQKAMPIYHINYTPGEDLDKRRDWLVMWTPTFGASTATPNDPAAVAMVVRGLKTPLPLKPNVNYTGTVEQIIEGGANVAIPSDGVVLHGRGAAADFLRRNAGKGTILSFKIDMDEPWASARQIIGGCNQLLVNWVIVKAAQTDCAQKERDPRMPRSAVAFEGKRVWLVTVDGRQPSYSVGTNSDEFAQFIFDLGARYALNLDGGGSTTFVVRRDGQPIIVNRPSDGKERPVGNALLITVEGAEIQSR